jgi:hypothetical protein
MRLMTGQTQPSFAARRENDVGFGVVGVFIFGSGLTKKAEPPPTRDVNRDSGTESAIRLRSEATDGQDGGWLRRLVRRLGHLCVLVPIKARVRSISSIKRLALA